MAKAKKSARAPSGASVKKAETVLLARALAKSLSPNEIRSVLEAEGFGAPIIEYVLSRTNLVMKKYTGVPARKKTIK